MEMTILRLEKLLLFASHMYYNTECELITDITFDILQNILKERSPSSKILKTIGSPTELVGKVKLPFWMGSADKIKPSSCELKRWLLKFKGPYVISSKLDGISGLLIYNNSSIKLYTRGDGTYGQDITHMLQYIKLPNINHNDFKILAIRGELIMKSNIFASKYKDLYPKSRSLVAGIVNSSVKHTKNFKTDIALDIDFIPYEIIQYDSKNFTFQEQFKLLDKLGFQVAKHTYYTSSLDSDILSKTLLDFKSNDKYEIDGIIIADSSKYYPRIENSNPEYLVAFKMPLDDQTRTTTVIDIEWNPSKHGILKPTVIFEPVIIGGDTIQRATGFNAKFINDNKLGVGSKISIIKSGDVIPYINAILTSSDIVLLPNVKNTHIKWKWNDSNVEAVLINAVDDNNVIIKRITHFMQTLGIIGVGEGIISRLFDAGYHSLTDILKVQIDSIASISGFSIKSASNIYKAMHTIIDKPIYLALLMDASNCFEGFAFKKLDILIKHIPNIMSDKIPPIELITSINGYSDISAHKIMTYLPLFKKWIIEHSMLKWDITNSIDTKIQIGNIMKSENIVMSGFRDDTIATWIKQNGGLIGDTVSSSTTILLVKDKDSTSSKMAKAKSLGIIIMTIEEFKDINNIK